MSGEAQEADARVLLTELIERGLLIESGVPGVYGHGATFEDIRTRLDALVSAEAASRGAEHRRIADRFTDPSTVSRSARTGSATALGVGRPAARSASRWYILSSRLRAACGE